MIELGLHRITKLLSILNNPQCKYKCVHVAGTNGKGSTLAYLSSILTHAKIRNGKFTSPHLIEYNDSLSINDRVYPRAKFDQKMNEIKRLNTNLELQCTEFEILTATALKIFHDEMVEIALIEVGVGGRLDATNVLRAEQLIACGITKISMDHESLLGDSIEKIAFEKAGIVKDGVSVFIDSTNVPEVIDVVRKVASERNAKLEVVIPSDQDREMLKYSPLKGSYQINNLSLALRILKEINIENVIDGIKSVNWPGRLQNIKTPFGDVLIDGAHNENAAIELRKYLNETYGDIPKVFVIGMTKGKNVRKLISQLVGPNDIIVPTSFSQPENMPWIKSESLEKLKKVGSEFCEVKQMEFEEVFKLDRPVIVCGSLYLCADILKKYS
ncbi:unnamed protein product [Candida verbasci]|uniref:Dihydrofolate synthetase n=1 Tax=Candida verbasci TaxID=1227364 RepID=A0A9W4U0Y5_9ASCO|nr:unnamed protein product [Candida verbasci]